jgi:diguanylate cyclase (GGDEF)-like protein
MTELLRVGILEVTFALLFTVLALYELIYLRRQRQQLRRRMDRSRLEAHGVAELSLAHATLQRRYGQARALIDLLSQFNQAMAFQAVLERLSRGLSQFFAGDDVVIWIARPDGSFELATRAGMEGGPRVGSDEGWLRTILAQGATAIPPFWQQMERPWMAAPLMNSRGSGLGVVVLSSQRRTAYTAEDAEFLHAVLGHAAMAIQNAARFEMADRLSRLDVLTGLGNRGDFDRALHESVARAVLEAGSLSILLADVDHFKHINDSRGHPEGDRVLRRIAQLIALTAIEPNRAFRIGGEEFAVLLHQQAKAAALIVGLRLCARVAQETFFEDRTRLTLSIGVASLPEDGEDPATLITAADQALYRAKADGRNRVRAA